MTEKVFGTFYNRGINMNHLTRIQLEGYKSIRHMDFDFKNINIFIGGNGAGKSNLLSFFDFLQRIGHRELQNAVIEQGGANVLLFNGRKVTDSCLFQIYRDDLMFYGRLKARDGDSLYFAQQGLYNYQTKENFYAADGFDEIKDEGMLKKTKVIDDIRTYHFHDTSASSLIKSFCDINNNMELAGDGGNLAAMLYRIKTNHSDSYEQIVKVIRLAAPYFQDFILRENPINPQKIRLEWRKTGCSLPFGAEQLSDGTLRFICLTVLLCLPENMRKDVICIDEPELGMHPFAIQVISELIKKYATDRQVIIATQSTEFINHFFLSDIVIVNQRDGESSFERLKQEDFDEWLTDYTIGELWQKNMIGGRPFM